jgi:hypothetical protein
MRRLLASRGASVAAAGILVALIASGGYALASGGSSKKITVCVSHKGGTLYKAKRCAKHDKKLTWNKQGIQGVPGQPGGTGPQGPGATTLVYNATATASSPTATIGTLGPYTLTGTCASSAGSTTFNVKASGSPSLQVDGFSVGNTATFGESTLIAGPLSNVTFGVAGPSTTQDVESGTVLLFPAGGAPFEITATLSAAGGTAVPGVATNTCRLSIIITPAAAPAAAAFHAPARKFSGPLIGR